MRKVKNSLNATQFPSKGERFTQPSMTIPDQTMTIREILRRYASGLPIDGQKIPLYEGEEYYPDPRTMDLAEREEMAARFKEELSAITGRRTNGNSVTTTAPTDPPTLFDDNSTTNDS